MIGIEQYKYKANNLRILGIALMSPFFSLANRAMTETAIHDIFSLRGLVSFTVMVCGLFVLGQGQDILEKCDGQSTRIYKSS